MGAMSESARPRNGTNTGNEGIPSVPEILDAVGFEAGLNAFDEDACSADEEEVAREVAKAMSKVRPLLGQYQQRYQDLAGRLSHAQATAMAATREARERSQGHLRTFDRLLENCGDVRRGLNLAAVESSGEERTLGGGGSFKKKATRRAAEADELVARHRSLVQRRRRMRSALQVLEVSDKAKAALESAEQPGRRGERADKAFKSIDLLRSLLGEVPGSPATANPGAPAAAAAAGGADKHTLVDEDGELAKVARGRLEWLTRRLRAELSSELGRALREVDPLAAAAGDSQGQGAESGLPGPDEERRREGLARVEAAMERLLALQFGGNWRFTDALSKAQGKAEAGSGGGYSGTRDAEKREASRTELTGANVGGAGSGGGGWWRGDGAVWALDGLLEPVAVRFRFHFEGERQTNRVDRPEWFLSFLLKALEAYRPLLEGNGDGDAGGVDRLAYFARGLALLARRRLRAQLAPAASDGSLLSHTVEEALAFDRYLDREAGYAECPTRFPGKSWPRCVEVFAQDVERFRQWMESDAAAARAKLDQAAVAPGAWRAVGWKNGPRSSTPTTHSAVALCSIFSDLTERYRPLRDPSRQLRFARNVQAPILRSYADMVDWRANECRPASVFRDKWEQTAGLTPSWAAALGATTALGHELEDTSPIGRWRCYCLALSSCAYVLAVLRDSEDDVLFAEMSEAAAAAAAVSLAAAVVGGSKPLEAVGNVVGAAVEGVSQAVTSVATTAETATAEVVRAVGAQGTIIGPTHAISAALTSLKGAAAARRARKTSLSPTLAESSKEGYGRDGVPRAATGAGGKVVSGVIGAESSGVGGNSRNGIGGTGSAAAAESGARLRDDGDSSGGIGSGSGDGATSALMDAVADAERLYGLDAGGRGSIFGEEIGRYRDMLNALMREAVSSCRDGFLMCAKSYVRAWDRGVAVVVPTSRAVGTAAVTSEPSGRLAAGVELLGTALAVAEDYLPSDLYRRFWTALARELDTTLATQIVGRRPEMTQDEGLQLREDLKALMGPFSVSARHRPEKHFPELTESALLLSLQKSQLRSLAGGLEAHGGGIGEAHRGSGWEGWREEGGGLSPEGAQMRDMLENMGVHRLGPVQASFLLDKRVKGDGRVALRHHSVAAAAAVAAAAEESGDSSPHLFPRGMQLGGAVADGGRIATTGGQLSAAPGEEAGIRSYG